MNKINIKNSFSNGFPVKIRKIKRKLQETVDGKSKARYNRNQ